MRNVPYALLVVPFLFVVACSSGSDGNGPSDTGQTQDTTDADQIRDTGTNDSAARDTYDGADTAELDTGRPDTTDTSSDTADGDTGTDVEPTATGETCPSSCPADHEGPAATRCDGCEGEWCFYPPPGGATRYCTRTCIPGNGECDDLGTDWYCATDFQICRNEEG